MQYLIDRPDDDLSPIVKSFWMIDGGDDATISEQKIVPDGYPEIVLHYRKPYRINLSGHWKDQANYLIAGQIRNHFLLANSGKYGMFAIKFQPWALRHLFGLDMSKLTDRVVTIEPTLEDLLGPVIKIAISRSPFEEKTKLTQNWLREYLRSHGRPPHPAQRAAELILEHKGAITMREIVELTGLGERSIQRYFQTHIGLSPKYYSRVIRLAHIFKLITAPPVNWSDIVYLAGFYDQAHFISNFKEFTGTNPRDYDFAEQNMANFFLLDRS